MNTRILVFTVLLASLGAPAIARAACLDSETGRISEACVRYEMMDKPQGDGSAYYNHDTDGRPCAEIKVMSTPQSIEDYCDGARCMFIIDIRVDEAFKDCRKGLGSIMADITGFTRALGMDTISLEDNAYMQFPGEYRRSADAPYKWALAYLKKDPGKPSIYMDSAGGGFVPLTRVSGRDGYGRMLGMLAEVVGTYNTTTPYDLVTNARSLQTMRRRIAAGDAPVDEVNAYGIRLAEFDENYQEFDRVVSKALESFFEAEFQSGELHGFPAWYIEVFGSWQAIVSELISGKSFHAIMNNGGMNLYMKKI